MRSVKYVEIIGKLYKASKASLVKEMVRLQREVAM
jgi:hypothetical protein